MFALVHRSPGTGAVRAAAGPAVCSECGHPAVARATSPVGRLARRVRPHTQCYVSMYEYSVLRDECCGCRSAAHHG